MVLHQVCFKHSHELTSISEYLEIIIAEKLNKFLFYILLNKGNGEMASGILKQ